MSLKIYDTEQVSGPIAREIVDLIVDKKVSYQTAREALLIAQEILDEETGPVARPVDPRIVTARCFIFPSCQKVEP